MTRQPPPEDWVAYLVVLSVVAAIMYGKYLIGRGDKPIDEVLNEDLEETIDKIEEKLK